MLPDGVARARIAQPGEDVPGRGNGEEEQNAGGQAELTPAAPISGEQQVRHGGEEEEDRSHHPLGQHGQRQGSPGQVKAGGFPVFQPDEKIVKSKGQQQGKQDFGNEDAGEQKNSHAGQNAEGGIERRALAIGATAPGPGQNGEAKYPQGEGKMGGEYVESEEVVIGGGQPIGQRRLFQVADAIHLQGDPVAAARHLTGRRGMGGIRVIQQGGRKERRHVHRGENQQQQRPGSHWERGLKVFSGGASRERAK